MKMKMPDLATTEGSDIMIQQWCVEVGNMIKRGQPLLEVETDKSVMTVESIASGMLDIAHVEPGDAVSVGDVIATLEVDQAHPVTAPLQPDSSTPKNEPSDQGDEIPVVRPKKKGGMFARNRMGSPGDELS